MKAISYNSYGGPEQLQQTEAARPKVAPASVLIQVKSAAVNPVDWKIMAGYLDGMMDVQFPVIPGWDVSGVVAEVGLDTPEFAVGDEVVAYARKDFVSGGTFAEYVSAPVRTVARKPKRLSWDQAAGLPLAGLTAYQLLQRLEVSGEDTVLVHAASGGVGAFAVQIAVARGARVIGTASQRNHDYLKSLGAEPIAYGHGLIERVRSLAPDGIDVVADLVGGVLDETKSVLAPSGRHGSIADGSVAEAGGVYLWVRPVAEDLAVLSDLADQGLLSVDVAQTFDLADAADAFRASQEGHTRGKIAIRIS